MIIILFPKYFIRKAKKNSLGKFERSHDEIGYNGFMAYVKVTVSNSKN